MDAESIEITDYNIKNFKGNGDVHKPEAKIQVTPLMSPIEDQKQEYHDKSPVKHPTNYVETLTHLFRGNVGPGIFAMGDAFKNSGIILGSLLVPILGLICVHCEHLLVNASNHIKQSLHLSSNPDFATTVELCFANGPPKLQFLAPYMRQTINLFLCLTQFGFCCVYFVFISSNIKQITDFYGIVINIHLHMAIILIPILLSCVVRNLKYLTPLSIVANVFMLFGIISILYFSCQAPFGEVKHFANLEQLPLFFGTALYAFEGIGLVLPLQNEMKKPKQFDSLFGILNVGMTAVIIFFWLIGLFSYLKYGNDIKGSVTLNLPESEKLAIVVKVLIPLGVLLTFALQFYIPIDIMFPIVVKRFGPFRKPALAEIIFRMFFVLVTFTLAEIIPFLNLFISLVGSFCSSMIALIFPTVLEFVTAPKVTFWIIFKNSIIIGIGVLGCVTGSYESIKLIVDAFKESQK